MGTRNSESEAHEPRQERGKVRRAALLDAAEALIAENGLDGFAMADVAKRAGSAHGSLYQFFPSRIALLLGLHARHLARLEDAMIRARDKLLALTGRPDAAGFVRAYLDQLQDFLDANPTYRLVRLGLPETWQGAEAEKALDARLLNQLAQTLAIVLPTASLQRRKTSAEFLIELIDTFVVLQRSEELKAEMMMVLELYLHQIGGNLPPAGVRF
jgi:AcrR family transcriptional regulator